MTILKGPNLSHITLFMSLWFMDRTCALSMCMSGYIVRLLLVPPTYKKGKHMPSQIPQDDLTFDEAMNTVCPECGDKAQIHRLTRTGTLYCLGYNKEAQKKKRWFAARRPIDVYFTPVKNLVRSPLSKEVGAVIDYNLHSSLNAGILLF